MIPKKIHYCWFGGKELPKLAKKCIQSWKKYCPDYEIIEWNESNFDININKYVKQAYEHKKWAFVSDVARLYALYNVGGIYMDTDVELTKNIDKFLEEKGFSSFENVNRIQTGILACEKENKIIKEFLEKYENREFIKSDGNFDLTTNVTVLTSILEKYGLKKNNQFQILEDFAIYPCEYFCPLDFDTKVLNVTENTYAIHWFDGSWVPSNEKFKIKCRNFVKKIIGKKNINKIKKMFKGKKDDRKQ